MRRSVLLLASLVSLAGTAGAQEIALSERGPRFLLASTGRQRAVEIDPARAPIFQRRVTLALEHTTVGEALAAVGQQAGIRVVYSRDVLDPAAPARIKAEEITVAGALTEILLDARVDVVLSDLNRVTLAPRKLAPPPQIGAISGRVTDAKTSQGIEGAEVLLEGTRWRTLTGQDGQYRVAEVEAGSYTVVVRRIGYQRQSGPVTVVEGQEATADFALQPAVTRLEELVTTGTLVPTEVKALPTPVTVIREDDIARQQPHTMQELLRQSVPTAVAWDTPDNPQFTVLSTRGSSAFSTGAPQMKVFVDGIEMAHGAFAGIDPSSIGRVEVVRGPQAATIYGSNAIGGVVQVYTKRGDPDRVGPRVSAEAGLGMVQTPYAGFDGVLRQQYAASVRGGGTDVNYSLGGSYSRTGDWLPNGELSARSNPSVYGGVHFARDIVSLDVSGRYFVNSIPSVYNPQLGSTGFFNWSKPNYLPSRSVNQTVGARLSVAATSWWQNAVTLGVDEFSADFAQERQRLTTPADTLLTVGYQSFSRRSIGFNTSVKGALSARVSGSFIVGFDHFSRTEQQFFTGGALNSTGVIQTASGQSISGIRTLTKNYGYFGQAQVAVGDALFLTAGLRADQNTDFGDDLGTPVSPRVGVSFVQSVSGAILKLRSSYGRAIRPPSPGTKGGNISPTSVILPSPLLAPERQRGWDAGVDVTFGSHASLSVTYYNQIAENLIQLATLETAPILVSQYQNVGRVKNTGVEVDGTLYVGRRLQLKGQYGYARSRIAQLAPGYAGDLQLGDQSLLVPKHTAGASASLVPSDGTALTAGLTYVGSWFSTDALAFYSCLGGTAPCRPGPGLRPYTTAYPGFIKLNASVTQRITSLVSGFASVDNLTNNQAYERWNLNPIMGRITTVGLRFQY